MIEYVSLEKRRTLFLKFLRDKKNNKKKLTLEKSLPSGSTVNPPWESVLGFLGVYREKQQKELKM